MAAFNLPTFIPMAWDRKGHAVRFAGVREARGKDLEAAVSRETDRATALAYGQLLTAFNAAGGNPGKVLADVVSFPSRQPGGRGNAPRTVRVVAEAPVDPAPSPS